MIAPEWIFFSKEKQSVAGAAGLRFSGEHAGRQEGSAFGGVQGWVHRTPTAMPDGFPFGVGADAVSLADREDGRHS